MTESGQSHATPRGRSKACARCDRPFAPRGPQKYCCECAPVVRSEQRRAISRRYAQRNRLLVAARRKLYYAKNRQRERAQHREWVAKNKGRIREYSRSKRTLIDPKLINAKRRERYLGSRDRILARNRDYRHRNAEKVRESRHRRYWGNRSPETDRKRPGPQMAWRALYPGAKRRPKSAKGFITEGEYQACLKDPRLCWTVCGPGLIPCLKCRGKFRSLPVHLRVHLLTAATYKDEFKLNRGASLTSLDLQKRRRQKSNALRLGAGKAGTAALGRWGREHLGLPGLPRRLQSSLNQRDAQRRRRRRSAAKKRRADAATTGKRKQVAEKSEYVVGREVDRALPRFEQLCAEIAKLPKRARTSPKKLSAALGADFKQRELEAAARAPGTPLQAARWFVSMDRKMPYDTVATYHKRFRKAVP